MDDWSNDVTHLCVRAGRRAGAWHPGVGCGGCGCWMDPCELLRGVGCGSGACPAGVSQVCMSGATNLVRPQGQSPTTPAHHVSLSKVMFPGLV